MSTQRQALISLDECITAYMNEAELSNHKYFKLWHLAIRAMDTLGLDFFYAVKSVKLPVNGNLTVNLPPDCVRYSKVGVLNDRGEVIPLSYNNNLTTYADLLPTRLEQTQDNTLFDFYYFNTPIFYNFWNDGTFTNLYGLPSGAPFVGSFKIDEANGIILLGENFGYPYVILEYIASPKEGEQYYVPVQFRESIISFLAWKNAKIGAGKYAFKIEGNYKNEFYNERRLARNRYKPFYLEEAYNLNLEMQRMAVKA